MSKGAGSLRARTRPLSPPRVVEDRRPLNTEAVAGVESGVATEQRRIVLPGGSGYLGRHLSRRLTARGEQVVVLTRGAAGQRHGVRYVHWDARTLGPWVTEVDGAHAVVHLSGKRVDVRPTRRNVDELVRSRVEAVRVVGDALTEVATPPAVWVQVATLAIFGEGGDDVLAEDAVPSGDGPRQMVAVALAWEHAFEVASAPVDRRVLLRCGVAIGPDDPALEQLTRLARFGLGGRIGSGRQWVSWIALDDLLGTLERAIDDDAMSGLYHLTSPNPVRNTQMMAIIRRATGRGFGVPSPAPLTRAGAWLLGSDPALALTGRRGLPGRLQQEGGHFALPALEDAVHVALERRR